MAKQFRLTPDDLEEAKHILKLISADLDGNMAEYTKDRGVLLRRTQTEARWQGIVADLSAPAVAAVAVEESTTATSSPATTKPGKEEKKAGPNAQTPPAK